MQIRFADLEHPPTPFGSGEYDLQVQWATGLSPFGRSKFLHILKTLKTFKKLHIDVLKLAPTHDV